jgi:hypothetical protein
VQAQKTEAREKYCVALDFFDRLCECDYLGYDYPKQGWVTLINVEADGGREHFSHLIVPTNRILYIFKKNVEEKVEA